MNEAMNEKDTEVKVAAYLRLSRDDGEEGESNSISNQRAIIVDFVSSRGMTIEKEYVDDGYTGSNFDRPGFKKMLEDIRNDKINCIVVKDLSRFARNLVEAGRYIDQLFPVWQVRFIAINDFFDSGSASAGDTFSVSIKNLLNELYCHDISMKIKATLDMKRHRGDYIGNYAPYGYSKSPENHNKLIINEAEALVVKMVFDLKLDGMNTRHIAEFLNAHGIKSPAKRMEDMGYICTLAKGPERKWSAQAVAKMLSEETYTGTLVQGKVKKKSFKKGSISATGKEEWIKAENAVPPIISRRTFEYVQDLNLRGTETRIGRTHVYIFSGFLRCGDCGQPMRRYKTTQHGNTSVFYVCSEHAEKKNCSYHRIKEDLLLRKTAAAIREHIEYLILAEQKLISRETIPDRKHVTESMMTSVDRKLKAAVENVAYLQDANAKIYQDAAAGTLSRESNQQFSEVFTKRLAQAEDEIKSLQEAKKKLVDDRNYLIPWIESLRPYRGFTELSRRLLVMAVEDIFIYEGGRVKVVFRHAQQIEDLMKMVLNEDEKIIVPRRMNIEIGETEIIPVTIQQPTVPEIPPCFGNDDLNRETKVM